jgi:hypothetical protein
MDWIQIFHSKFYPSLLKLNFDKSRANTPADGENNKRGHTLFSWITRLFTKKTNRGITDAIKSSVSFEVTMSKITSIREKIELYRGSVTSLGFL